ncbi:MULTISPECIES: hypothetical protein [unclassified Prochlorococcus]|uniref:hypothetical protein n=1 Tax=unclassified Prochlorococcus TaxID=2627481 RepID=UPI00097CC729|nr:MULTISPECIES: hypothetical protein [unclassified Prochlorococcus]AQL29796.1 hypothetical protein BSR22_00760 [Prochlorococcus sp. RS50]AQL31574.1 hypothetical protein BS620_00715 [Prochlorococcus sp. RS01]AQL34526.1 hypothetical protein BS621_07035 [Prochlorococcus sp. RS04]
MKRICTIILNRNLPDPTNALYEHLKKYDANYNDTYVIEAGSDKDKLSKYCTWYINNNEAIKNGLRYGRGMNYALLELFKEKNWDKYEAFFLLTNDTELYPLETIKTLLNVLEEHPMVGILSPASKNWGEISLLNSCQTKYFWFIHNNALLLRRKFIEMIIEKENPNHLNFLFDGSNFRGYFTESEIIAKAYVNNWAAAITKKVFAEENETYLIEKSDLIRTEDFFENRKLYLEEGKKWIKRKYGFNSRWDMNQYVKNFYDKFFEFHPELEHYKI